MALPLILLGNSNLLCLNLKVLPLKDTFQSCNFRHKADYLKSLISDQDVVIHAAYGSSKDISVYSSLELKYDQIFVFGKPSKKTKSITSHLAKQWLCRTSCLFNQSRWIETGSRKRSNGNPQGPSTYSSSIAKTKNF